MGTPLTITRPTKDETLAWRKRMEQARDATGMTLDQASRLATSLMDPDGMDWGPSKEAVRRMEKGPSTEHTVEPAYVMALAAVYKVPLEKLSPLIYGRALCMARMVNRLGLDRAINSDPTTSIE